MSDHPKLIILRGPSGSGKSTVSRELLRRATRPMLRVAEDEVRMMFSTHRQPGHEHGKDLATQAVLFGLEHGYDVVYEGILNFKTTGANLAELVKAHKGEHYLFYLDVSFDETVRRHDSRPQKSDFGADSMKRWWDYAAPTGHAAETVIPEASSLEETITCIDRVAGLGLR